jgi:Putative peptidoglycan binding domain
MSTIKQLQERLTALGYACGLIDGLVGKRTRAATRAFQADHGLSVTGEFDDATIAALAAPASAPAGGFDRAVFFDGFRTLFPGGKMTVGQVAGTDDILDAFEAAGTPIDHQAYMLATAFHETAHTMQPVRETLADSDDRAIAILERSWARGRMPWVKSAYWRKDKDGKSWLGRGLVQLTHKDNYEKLSPIVGVDLVARPEAAMEMDVAIKIMMEGMRLGLFTGRKLSDTLDGVDESDAEDAREFEASRPIINGKDKAAAIAAAAIVIEKAIRRSVR